MTSSDPCLLTGRLVVLRPMTIDDAPVLLARESLGLASSQERAEETERLRSRIAQPTTLEGDGFLALAVEHEGALVGDIQARAPRHGFPPGVCEIGLTLFVEARGRGLGTDAVRVFTQHLHDAGWVRVQASTAVSNDGMRRVLERSGYVLEGALRSFAPNEYGGRDDYAMYGSVRQPAG